MDAYLKKIEAATPEVKELISPGFLTLQRNGGTAGIQRLVEEYVNQEFWNMVIEAEAEIEKEQKQAAKIGYDARRMRRRQRKLRPRRDGSRRPPQRRPPSPRRPPPPHGWGTQAPQAASKPRR